MNKDAIHEASAAAPNRRGFIRNATLAGAAGAAVLLTTRTAQADKIFNGGNQNEARSTFLDIQRHENAHVAFLLTALIPPLFLFIMNFVPIGALDLFFGRAAR